MPVNPHNSGIKAAPQMGGGRGNSKVLGKNLKLGLKTRTKRRTLLLIFSENPLKCFDPDQRDEVSRLVIQIILVIYCTLGQSRGTSWTSWVRRRGDRGSTPTTLTTMRGITSTMIILTRGGEIFYRR